MGVKDYAMSIRENGGFLVERKMVFQVKKSPLISSGKMKDLQRYFDSEKGETFLLSECYLIAVTANISAAASNSIIHSTALFQ